MLLQSGLALGTESQCQPTSNQQIAAVVPMQQQQQQLQHQQLQHQQQQQEQQQEQQEEITRYLDLVQDTLKEGWSVHATKEGRLYYCNHLTRTAGWLPPAENWGHNIEFPYGWEKAIDSRSRPYFINHLSKATTYEVPENFRYDDKPPEPRLVVLTRSPTMGFGFVAGSERPVIVRFVTESGPSVNKLEPGDRILAVNNEDVKDAPRDHVIQLVRSCDTQVSLLVCQPMMEGCAGRKSTLLSAGKKAKLRTRPNRVRFAESVCVNGTPLFPPSAFSLGDICVPQMANVLKVFLENGQTKSFKYDSSTTVQDVVTSLRDKLCLSAEEHFSLVLEHVKSVKRNKLTLLDPQDTLARIAARPGAHKLRCLFRVTFVPVSAALLAQKDLNALDYLYMQCCNDVTQERFCPELQADVALRLAALNIHQHSLANNISPAKLTVKTVEREFGLERFVPSSLIESMKRKELRRLMAHFLKLNSQMTGSSSKMLTQLQAKIHYLDIISGLPSYGAKCFSTNQRDGIERVLLISPRFGLSQIAGVRNSVPQPICNIEHLTKVEVTRDDDVTNSVSVHIQGDKMVCFLMDDRDACEFSLVLAGYYRLLNLNGKELPIHREREELDEDDNAPIYVSQHFVWPAAWSYLPTAHGRTHNMVFYAQPPYHPISQLNLIGCDDTNGHCDKNMNTTLSNNNHKLSNGGHEHMDIHIPIDGHKDGSNGGGIGFCPSKPILVNGGIMESRNEEVLRRVAEMQKMVESSEKYLNEHGDQIQGLVHKGNGKMPWKDTSVEVDSDCESMSSSKVSSNEDAPQPGAIKHSDSLVLLTDTMHGDLIGNGGIGGLNTKGVNILNMNGYDKIPDICKSPQNSQKVQRRAHGLSQLLNDLHALSNDLSQSESDSESVCTPNSSPIHRNVPGRTGQKVFRTSFGLHSPDNSVLGPDSKDTNLREYLRQLKEASNKDEIEDIDLAAKKLSELYGFEIGDDTFIETDPDLIDLTAIPPPQTPDELDALTVINAAPHGFDDTAKRSTLEPNGDLEQFLAKVVIAPPIQKVTPAKELTPEEIMSFIIPPPPGLEDDRNGTALPKSETEPIVPRTQSVSSNYPTTDEENFYINSLSACRLLENYSPPESTTVATTTASVATTAVTAAVDRNFIEYATVERKGPFSCCSKSKKPDISNNSSNNSSGDERLQLPPKRCPHSIAHQTESVPERPPKSLELQCKHDSPVQSPHHKTVTFHTRDEAGPIPIPAKYYELEPPKLPPRNGIGNTSPPIGSTLISLPPRKPHLPPIPIRPIFRNPAPLPKLLHHQMVISDRPEPAARTIGSPQHLLRHHHNATAINQQQTNQSDVPSLYGQFPPPIPAIRTNGHYRSHSDCPPVCLKNPPSEHKPQLSLLCSPQMSRKLCASPTPTVCQQQQQPQQQASPTPSPLSISHTAPHVSQTNGIQYSNSTSQPITINVESLLGKTDVAMAGLLVKLDQIAAQCSAAQAAGGGVFIDEQKFQIARDELTEQTLQLVTASKQLVVAMSTPAIEHLPEHLTRSLTALRRITELAHDMTKHTTSPLQTRNIVLKVHDVASTFRELAGVELGPFGAGPLALQAECLANVLATLLRSLRVFSP